MVAETILDGLSAADMRGAEARLAEKLGLCSVEFVPPWSEEGRRVWEPELYADEAGARARAWLLAAASPGKAFAAPYADGGEVPEPSVRMGKIEARISREKQKLKEYVDAHAARRLAYGRITCHSCGSSISVRHVEDGEEARRCPACGADMRAEGDKAKVARASAKIASLEEDLRKAAENLVRRTRKRWVVAASDERLSPPGGGAAEWCVMARTSAGAWLSEPMPFMEAAWGVFRRFFAIPGAMGQLESGEARLDASSASGAAMAGGRHVWLSASPCGALPEEGEQPYMERPAWPPEGGFDGEEEG